MGQADVPQCVYCDRYVWLSTVRENVITYYCGCGERVDVKIGSGDGEELL